MKNIICHVSSWELCVCVCVRTIEATCSEIALSTGNPSTAWKTLEQAGLWYQGSSFIRPPHFRRIRGINFQSRQHNPSHQIFGRQVENCSASWRRQNPFLLAIFCNENSRNECAITCGNKFQILSHKSSVLKISNCKLTPAYLNFKMLISLCVWIATKERQNIFQAEKGQEMLNSDKRRPCWKLDLLSSISQVKMQGPEDHFLPSLHSWWPWDYPLRLACGTQARLEMYVGFCLFLDGYSNFHLLCDSEMDHSGIRIMSLLKVPLNSSQWLTH